MNDFIIFLDVDGVLNQLQRNYFIDVDCVERLAILVNKLNAKIVLSSTWRFGYSNTGKCSPQVEKLKVIFDRYNIKIVGRTPNLGDRGAEINKYIKDKDIKRYIVIDDDKSEFKTNVSNIYFTKSSRGISKEDIKSIMDMIK